MIRLVQIHHPREGRRIALVDEPWLRVLASYTSVYELAMNAVDRKCSIGELLAAAAGELPRIGYDEVYNGESEWHLLPCFDHPTDPAHCLVTGTGLTHKASAENRQSMHGANEPLTDSMKMYRIGLEGGTPLPGAIGAPPEWFYKGHGEVLRAHGQSLDVPNHGHDGGEEAEIAGIYIVDQLGRPHRVGLAQGNEFSDHVMEAKNYLYLAASKLRKCSLGPELIIGHDFAELQGRAAIERNGQTIWESPIASGHRWMSHTMGNLEHHHFKHETNRRPGDAHVHFFGADVFSFRDRLVLQESDQMVVAFEQMGRALRNPLHLETTRPELIWVNVL